MVACLMCLVRILREKKASDSEWVKRTNVMFVANFVVIVMK